MPLFIKNNKKILYVHIPKTGGTHLECYLINKKFKINLYNKTKGNNIIPDNYCKKHSLQHQEYKYLYKYRELLKIPFDDNLLKFCVVRNPYDRMISELFWASSQIYNKNLNIQMKEDMTKEEVYKLLLEYFKRGDVWDNHDIPQYKFIEDENREIIKDIKIFKLENFEKEMHNLGFSDYKNPKSINKNYDKYLNEDSIKLINEKYKKDFELFGYEII